MAEGEEPPPVYGLADFLEEIDTVLFEKRATLERLVSKNNEPVAGLTRIRIERQEQMRSYLLKIDAFQREKAATEAKFDFGKLKRPAPKVEEKPAEPEKIVHQEPDPLPDKAPKVEEPAPDDDEW